MNNNQELNNHEINNYNLEFTRGVIGIILESRFTITFGVTGLVMFACVGSLIDEKIKNKKGEM